MGVTTTRLGWRAAVPAAAVLALATGCFGSNDGSRNSDPIQLGSQTTEDPAPSGPIEEKPDGPPLAKADAVSDGTRLHLEVTSLRRTTGGMVTLKVTMEAGGKDYYSTSTFGGSTFDEVYLVDAAGQKKYLPVTDSKDNCVCSEIDSLKVGEPQKWFTTFPAPPADVKKLSIYIPTFSPIENVPLAG
jgi:hypothetical protein